MFMLWICVKIQIQIQIQGREGRRGGFIEKQVEGRKWNSHLEQLPLVAKITTES